MEALWRHLTGDHRACDENCKYKLNLMQTNTKPERGHQLIRLPNVNATDPLMVRLNLSILLYHIIYMEHKMFSK